MKIVTAVVFFLLFSFAVSAQNQKFTDQPFAIGIGYLGGYRMVDTDVIDNYIQGFTGKEMSSGFYAQGVSGYLYIGVIPFLRIGGMSFSGSTMQDYTNVPTGDLDDTPFTREAEYRYSTAGLTVEYTFPFLRDIALSAGALIGRGSIEISRIEYYRQDNWEEIWGEGRDWAGYLGVRQSVLTHDFWIFSPMINVDIPLHRLVSLRVGANYTIGIGDEWTQANGETINEVPGGISNNAFSLQAGIFVGFFSF